MGLKWTILGMINQILLGQRRIERKLDQLIKGEETIMADLQGITDAVAAETSIDQSAITLIQNLAAAVASLQPNQAAIDALAAQLTASAEALSAAVTANTPAA